jgi:hypothetical protein
LGVLFSVPEMVHVLVVSLRVNLVITEKFCRLLAPVSGSSSSFAVTASPPRSIPRPAVPEISFMRMVLPVP